MRKMGGVVRLIFRHWQSRTAISTLCIISLLSINILSLITLGAPSYAQPAQSTGFVTRSGAQLMLNGARFRFAGTNIYWLGLDEGAQTYPTPFRIDDALHTAAEMGVTVIRAHTLGVSVGCPLCLQPTLGNFNATAFQHIDYAIQAARAYGMRLIIPLTDNYHFFHGGKHTFTDWRGISDEEQFYFNPQVISDFQLYIRTLLTHVNSYTGVAYMNDPTIMAWETGNELLPPSSWTRTIADYIKSIDAQHLVMDGNYGVNANSLSIPSVDVYSDHFYPPDSNRLRTESAATSGANKAFISGEYDWQTSIGTPLSTFLTSVLNNTNVSGAMFWSLWPHDDTNGYFNGYGEINLTYPGDTADRRQRAQIIRAHGYAMQGLPVPTDSPPTIPIITSVVGKQIAWRGATLGDTYSVERAQAGPTGPWTVVCNRCTTDYSTPWTDATQPAATSWYRVRAYNRVGVAGSYSPVYATSTQSLLIDDLSDWSNTYSHSTNLHFDSSNPLNFDGDTTRIDRGTSGPGKIDDIVWHAPGLSSFTAMAYFWPGEPISPYTLYTSADGTSWTQVTPTIFAGTGNWQEYTYTVNSPARANFMRILWGNPTGVSWSPQLSQVVITTGPTVAPKLVDNLNDWSKTYSHSSNLGFDTTNPAFFNGDTSRAYRFSIKPGTNDEIVWNVPAMAFFTATSYFWPHEPISPYTLYTSADGTNWTQVTPTITSSGTNWLQYTYAVSTAAPVNFIKIRWGNLTGMSWSPQLGQVSIS